MPAGVTAQSLGVARDGRILAVQRAGTAAPPAALRVILNWFEELRAKIPTPAR